MPSCRRISVTSRAREGERSSHRSRGICSSSTAYVRSASCTMRIQTFPTPAGRANRACRPKRFGTIIAHAAAVAGEYPSDAPLLCFTWDGVGLGPDGTLWGGEALLWRARCMAARRELPSVPTCPEASALRASPGVRRWRCAGSAVNLGRRESSLGGPLLRARLRRRPERPVDDGGRAACSTLPPRCWACACRRATKARRRCGWKRSVTEPAAPVALPLARDARGVWRSDWAPLLPALLDARRRAGRARRAVSREPSRRPCATRPRRAQQTAGSRAWA